MGIINQVFKLNLAHIHTRIRIYKTLAQYMAVQLGLYVKMMKAELQQHK